MKLKELKEIIKDMPDDAVCDKWNTNYGWTVLRSVKYTEHADGTKSIDFE